MDLIIRQVRSEDVESCYSIESQCFSPEEAASLENIRLRQELFPQGFLVAEISDQIVGLINSGASDHPDLSDDNFKALVGHNSSGKERVIFSLAVEQAWRSMGIARQLLETFLSNAEADQVEVIRLICKQELVDFYARFGFENLGRSDSEHGGVSWWEMERV